MTPEEIQTLTDALLGALKTTDTPAEGSYGWLYVAISLIPTLYILSKNFNKVFVKAIEKVLDKLLKSHMSQMDDMIRIMDLHIEELVHVKKDVEENKEKIEEVEKTVENHRSLLDKLKEKC